ncbi:MAG TPA: hypothetical protein VKY74_25250, partial [Chloroflexia bacterium]|nr:hypothetical protein [Chloroflexia bacterium]
FGILLLAGALALSGVDWAGDLRQAVPAATGSWRFWVALVAIVEVADQMTPSAVDRKNWPVALAIGAVLGLLAWGGGTVLAVPLPAGWGAAVLQAGTVLSAVLFLPIALNLLLGAGLWLLARLL